MTTNDSGGVILAPGTNAFTVPIHEAARFCTVKPRLGARVSILRDDAAWAAEEGDIVTGPAVILVTCPASPLEATLCTFERLRVARR